MTDFGLGLVAGMAMMKLVWWFCERYDNAPPEEY